MNKNIKLYRVMQGGFAPLSIIPSPTLTLSNIKDPQLELDEFNEQIKNSMRVTDESKCYTEMKDKTSKCGTKEACTVAGIIKNDFCSNKISYNRSKNMEDHCKKMVEPSVNLCKQNVDKCRQTAVDEFNSCITPSLPIVQEETQVKIHTNLGCYNDDKNGHMDNTSKIIDVKMTPKMCITHCDSKNYNYAAVQNGDTCICGTEQYYNNNKILYANVDDTKCNLPCSGNSQDTKCGGVLKNAIYNVATQQYIGCKNDDNVGQFLNYKYDTKNTVIKCINRCKQDNFKFAALQSKNWCACGNDTEFNKTASIYSKTSAEACNIPCAGNNSELCGGLMKNNIYKL